MRVLLVDDEQLARDELRDLLKPEPDIEIIGACANAIEAIAAVNRLAPDVVFLDIQMPRVSGLEMISMLDPGRMPRIVFVTAFDAYAVQAFEEHAFDYMLKPIDKARLDKTLERLRQDSRPQDLGPLQPSPALRQIPCTGVNRVTLMRVEDVEYVLAKPSGIYVVGADGQERFTELTLRTLEEKTPLFRCHRQYLVNPDRIKEISFVEHGLAEIATIAGQTIPVSRRFLPMLKERLGIA